MQNHKIKTYIGFAVKARKVVFGLDNILTSKKSVRVIVMDKSLGESSRRKLNNYLTHNEVKVVELEDISLGEDILKRDNCKIIGINDENLAKAVIDEANS